MLLIIPNIDTQQVNATQLIPKIENFSNAVSTRLHINRNFEKHNYQFLKSEEITATTNLSIARKKTSSITIFNDFNIDEDLDMCIKFVPKNTFKMTVKIVKQYKLKPNFEY